MKFVFCTQRYVAPFVGGVDILTYRIASCLGESGHEVSIVAIDVSGDSSDLVIIHDSVEGVPVTRVVYDLEQRPRDSIATLRDDDIGSFFSDYLVETRPDIFVVMNLFGIGVSPIESAKKIDIPVMMIATDFTAVCRRGNLVTWKDEICQTGESLKSCSACFLSSKSLGRISVRFLNLVSKQRLAALAENRRMTEQKFANPLDSYWRQINLMQRRFDYVNAIFPYIGKVLVPNRFTYEVLERGGFRKEQLEELTWPIDTNGPLANIEREPSDYVRFLFIGRYHPRKGVHVLIEAFKLLERRKGARLVLYGVPDAGHENYFANLKEAVAGHEDIELNGSIENSRLVEAFSKADYFVLPSTWHENNTLVVPDALFSKTPVISSNIKGVTHLVIDGENGVLFEMGNVQDLSEKMQMAIDQHPYLFRRLSRPWSEALSIRDYCEMFVSISEYTLTTHCSSSKSATR